MKRRYEIDLSDKGIEELKKGLNDFDKWLKQKSGELCKRLADLGVTKAEMYFGNVIYDGSYDYEVHAEPRGNGYVVKANGEKILFIEFGSGLVGYGYPSEELNGMGPGTYPGKGHWSDPKGWYYEHGKKSHGNPPNMPMYRTVKELEWELEQIVREVFKS